MAHRYRLNPPISVSFVRMVEEKYGFSLPEDYFRFITEVGDRGAGPDYGIITAGDKRGQVFDTDNEGAYGFASGSFNEFYQSWLDRISDTEGLRKKLEEWKKRLQKQK